MADDTGVPLLDLGAQHRALEEELKRAFARVLASSSFIMGDEVASFEAEVAELVGAPHAIAVSSGTDALLVVLMALGIGPGAEVVTTPYSFFATAGCISRLGATPVFADIDPGTFNLDPARLPAAFTERTAAILPVHLFGQLADLRGITSVASERGVPLIEDAAQALGAHSGAGRAGAIGDAGCFSFFPSKNLGGFGDGGLVTTFDAELARRIRALRVHGAPSRYHHEWTGGNFRLDALQAALLRVKLPRLDAWLQARRRNATRYDAIFTAASLPPERLAIPVRSHVGHSYNQYVIRTDRRDQLQQRLSEAGIGSAVYYPRPLHLQPCFAHLGHAEGDFPHAEEACRSTLALPVYPELPPHSLEHVADTVLEVLANG